MSILDWFRAPDHDKTLQTALTQLLTDSPRMQAIWSRIQERQFLVALKNESLPGATEGSTRICANGAVVRIDVGKVRRMRDCLEVVIAHELFHVHDALFKWTPETFIEAANSDDHLNWDERPVEKSAIEQEDVLRAELRTLPRYKNIALTRKQQNLIANRRR